MAGIHGHGAGAGRPLRSEPSRCRAYQLPLAMIARTASLPVLANSSLRHGARDSAYARKLLTSRFLTASDNRYGGWVSFSTVSNGTTDGRSSSRISGGANVENAGERLRGFAEERKARPTRSRTSSPSWELAAERFFARTGGKGEKNDNIVAENVDGSGEARDSRGLGANGSRRDDRSRALLPSRDALPLRSAFTRTGRNNVRPVGTGRGRVSVQSDEQIEWLKEKNQHARQNLSTDRSSFRNGRIEQLISSKRGAMDDLVDGNFDSIENDNVDNETKDIPKRVEIKEKYNRAVRREARSEDPKLREWNRYADWGRKTWREASQSTLPKMVGQGLYGVGPVLAALSAGRREFFALYVQEGLDLSSGNKKKKDKKLIEKVLQIADKIGLKVIETSKHDLNMLVDSRPHQGLVLDASPLEMVSIRELEPVTIVNERLPIWIALDEVTDPQNLGAIIRSAYFFGVEGVVLCAKNSAPLSGVVSKASAGSLELIELRSCKNMMQFLSSSTVNGWQVLGGSVSPKAIPITEVKFQVPTVLVLGSEGTGLRPLVERSCTQLIRIPGNVDGFVEGISADSERGSVLCSIDMNSFFAVESLNVSVAAGVLLYQLAQRKTNV